MKAAERLREAPALFSYPGDVGVNKRVLAGETSAWGRGSAGGS